MADQYQNFTNPTIIPDQKYGWQSANQGMSDLVKNASGYLMEQHKKVQDLQLQQAQDLSKFKTLDQIYYGGAHSSQLDDLLSQNPYGKKLVSQQPQSLSTAGQGQTPGSMAAGANMIGMPGMSTMSGQSVLPSPIVNGSNGSSGTSMSPMNPTNGPVVTGMTQKAFEPPSITMQNPAGEAAVAGAKGYSEKMSGEMAGAQVGTAKDIQQLGMIKNAIKPLVESYDKAYNSKAGGLPAAGDIYGSTIAKNTDFIPRAFQNSIVPADTQKATGQFLANKNELVTKLQPLLSQQFGKDGSSRIMESLLNMSQQEIGDLNTPRDQFHGQLTGTISSLYRIAKASQAYKQDLQNSGQSAPDPDVAAQEIAKRMQLQTLQPEEQKELQGMIDDTLGNKPQQGGSQNPIMKQQAQTSNSDVRSQYNQLRASGVSAADAKKQLGL